MTQEGIAHDYFLSAGESLRIVSAGVTLVEALGEPIARLTLCPRHASDRAITAFQARAAF